MCSFTLFCPFFPFIFFATPNQRKENIYAPSGLILYQDCFREIIIH
uniref:Uncharacterized protein n=1 Tax=Rhizophora mucronata TaxID=61149 RepID=A0A2P2NS04_RHIMU